MRKLWSKKILAIVLSAAMVPAVLASCQQSPSASNSEGSPKSTVTINFWHNYSAQTPENETLMKVLIPKFEQENPGIKVNASSYEWQALHDKIISSASSGTLADVSRLDIAWVPEFQKAKILYQLDGNMPDFNNASSGLLENAMSTAKIGGHYYGLALDTNTKMLFYNKQAFDDAGIQAPKTIDEFINDAKLLSGKNKNGQQVWGIGEPALAGWNICPYIWSAGGSLTDDNYTKASGYINSDKTVKAVQMIVDLYKSGAVTGFNSGDIPATDGFGTGRYIMLLDGPWKFSEMAGGYPNFKYGTSVMPAGDGGSVSVLGGEDIGILNPANKDAAWKFMKFMTSEFAQEEMAKCSQIPVNKAALNSDTAKKANFSPFLNAITTAKARPPISTWPEIDSLLTSAVTSAVKGEKTVKQALDDLAVKVDQLLQNK